MAEMMNEAMDKDYVKISLTCMLSLMPTLLEHYLLFPIFGNTKFNILFIALLDSFQLASDEICLFILLEDFRAEMANMFKGILNFFGLRFQIGQVTPVEVLSAGGIQIRR